MNATKNHLEAIKEMNVDQMRLFFKAVAKEMKTTPKQLGVWVSDGRELTPREYAFEAQEALWYYLMKKVKGIATGEVVRSPYGNRGLMKVYSKDETVYNEAMARCIAASGINR